MGTTMYDDGTYDSKDSQFIIDQLELTTRITTSSWRTFQNSKSSSFRWRCARIQPPVRPPRIRESSRSSRDVLGLRSRINAVDPRLQRELLMKTVKVEAEPVASTSNSRSNRRTARISCTRRGRHYSPLGDDIRFGRGSWLPLPPRRRDFRLYNAKGT